MKKLLFWEGITLPNKPKPGTIYRLLPEQVDTDWYRERTDRNYGWITVEEQERIPKFAAKQTIVEPLVELGEITMND